VSLFADTCLQLEAVSLGSAVPRHHFDAEVHSTFNHSVNLRLVKNKRLITLVVNEEADLPQGIRLNTPPRFAFENWARGDSVVCQDRILWYEAKQVRIDLRMATRFTCDLPALGIRMTDLSMLAAWHAVFRLLANRWEFETRNLAGQTPAMAEIQKNAMELAEATRRNDSICSLHLAEKLIGLGPGLTPAGDDFLVGFLAGLWSSADGNQEHNGFLADFAREVVRFSRRTNDISRTYLFHAAHGQVSSRLATLVGAIGRGGSSEQLGETAEASLHVGHISGMAATAGLLVGLSVWDAPPSCLADIKALLPQGP